MENCKDLAFDEGELDEEKTTKKKQAKECPQCKKVKAIYGIK